MRSLLIIATLVLAGCATVAPAPGTVDWSTRQQELLALDSWRMTGRVAISVNGEGASAGIDWRQTGGRSDVAVTGPLGIGALRAVVDGPELQLEDGSGARLAGVEAERLLAQRLGTEVPIASLRYWLLGVPAPDRPFEVRAGPGGRPDALSQGGWEVRMERYGPAPGGELPVRLSLSRDGARVRLAVSRWELER